MRAKSLALAAAVAAVFVSTAPHAQVLFKNFLPGQSTASSPLGSADYLPVIQGGATVKLPGSNLATLNDTQTITNKIWNCNNQVSCVVRLGTDVTGTLPFANGGLGISAGTSGGVPYFSSASTVASSPAGAANSPIIWGGPGIAPAAGSRSGNTTLFMTGTGSYTSGHGFSVDANGNAVDNINAIFSNVASNWSAQQTFNASIFVPTAAQTATGTQAASLAFVKSQQMTPPTVSWLAGANPNAGVVMGRAGQDLIVSGIWCRLTIGGDSGATIDIYRAASGTGGTGGTKMNTTSCNAGGTVNADQQLITGSTSISAGQTVYLVATGTFAGSAGSVSLIVSPQ